MSLLMTVLSAKPFGGVYPIRASSDFMSAKYHELRRFFKIPHDRSCERELAEEIARVLDDGKLPDLAALRAVFGPDPNKLPTVHVQLASLNGYEALIGASYAGEAA